LRREERGGKVIFKRAIVSELSNTASAVFTVLFTIVFSVGLVRILGDAAGGRVDGQAVFQLVALVALTYLPTVLTLTLFIAVLMSLARAFRDSEMVVWFASGRSLLAWIGPVLRFGAPIIVLVALLSLVVSPWSQRQIVESRKRFESRDDVSKVAPGRFIESSAADRVFFVEAVDFDGARVHNIFVSHRSQGREGVIVAAQGAIEVRPNGERYLALETGRRYEGTPGAAEYRMTEFDRYLVRLDVKPDEPIAEVAARAKTTLQLWIENTPFTRAELLMRLGMPIVALLLALAAIPLSYSNPRVGRSFNLIIAVLAFLLYNNGLSVVQAWVQQERIPFSVGVWLVHAIVAAIVALLFVRRVYLQRWLPRWASPRAWRRGIA
ncbi:MAG TPA: LPS export ABC transporter permease LptF, partial [Burkholderiaceae bacterium]|nr:LPS export ABC transporter permease LptF [Burkholderiaceae bacterium]